MGAWLSACELPPPSHHPPPAVGEERARRAGLTLTAVGEGGLFVQSRLTVSKSLPGALVPNEIVAGLIPATTPAPQGFPSLPPPAHPAQCYRHDERFQLLLTPGYPTVPPPPLSSSSLIPPHLLDLSISIWHGDEWAASYPPAFNPRRINSWN